MSGTRPDWSAAVLLDRTIPDRRHRARLAAGTGVALLLAGLLVAIGAWIVVAAIVALTLAVVTAKRLSRALREHHSRARARRKADGSRRRLRRELERTRAGARAIGARAKPLAATGVQRLRLTTEKALAEGEKRSAATAATIRAASQRAREAAERHAVTTAARPPATESLRKEALRLNTAGSGHRRNGDPLRAKEHHLAALELIRRSGDRVAEALTLNNLALAMGTAGDEDGAIACFEQAQVVARDLDSPQYEGLIAANLAIAYRRRGLDEQAIRFLHVALDKLPADSGAYHRVEEQLRRAS
jgi:tetratricopeptide (TPR) repeat protein